MHANPAEVAYIQETLSHCEAIGLRRNPAFDIPIQTYADAVVDGYPCNDASRTDTNRIVEHAPCPRLTVLWLIEVEETGEPLAYFRNALVFQDHCFDVADLDDYEQLIQEILSTASDDWTPSLVRITEQSGLFSTPKVQLAIDRNGDNGDRHALEINGDKDFEVNLIAQLNRLVPGETEARFACVGDGGTMMIVWLTPAETKRLSEYLEVNLYIP